MSHIRITPPQGTYGDPTGGGESLSRHTTILNQTNSVMIAHNLNTEDIIIQCFTTEKYKVEPSICRIVDSNHVYLEFGVPQSGKCIIIG